MPTVKRLGPRRTVGKLTFTQLEFLIHGPSWIDVADEYDEDGALAAWTEHRRRIMALIGDDNWLHHGERPYCWWHYEHGRAKPADYRKGIPYLRELGAMSEEEAAAVAEHEAARKEAVCFSKLRLTGT